jgi:hypothetical protein
MHALTWEIGPDKLGDHCYETNDAEFWGVDCYGKKKFFYKRRLFNCVAVNWKAFKVNLMIAIVSKLTRFTLDELFWVMHINLFLKHMMPTT